MAEKFFSRMTSPIQLVVITMRKIGEDTISGEQIAQIKNTITKPVSAEDFNNEISKKDQSERLNRVSPELNIRHAKS